MPVEESATGVVKVVFGLTPKDSGKFIAVLAPVTVLTYSMMGRSILGERRKLVRFWESKRKSSFIVIPSKLLSLMNFLTEIALQDMSTHQSKRQRWSYAYFNRRNLPVLNQQ